MNCDSIFSTYSQGENRVTSSIIQALKNLPVNVVNRFLEMDNQNFIQFINQPKSKKESSESTTIPDAEISAKFNLLFETKTTENRVNLKQLNGHLVVANNKNADLVYLTTDQSKPALLIQKNVVWKNFQNLFDLISELMEDPSLILSERDQFLLKNLQDFFVESELIPVKDEVVIVAASSAWKIYEKYGVYVCQAGRSFRNVGWIGFYAEGQIQKSIAKIKRPSEDSQFPENSLEGDTELKKKLSAWLTDNAWAMGELLQVFDISNIESEETVHLPNSIQNDLRNANGRAYAFTQGQRYTSLPQLEDAKTTSDLLKR